MMDLAPIVLFIYNRPWHTLKTLEALEKNELADQSILFIYADGPKENASKEQHQNIEKAKKVAQSKQWCKQVRLIERNENWGLADNIVDGVTTIVNEYEKVIVLEDDIVTSPGFLKYMNSALNLYQDEDKVMHISGYMFPVKAKLPSTFFYNTASCWGWATWKRAWSHLVWDVNNIIDQLENEKLVTKFNVNGSYDFFRDLKANANLTLKTWAVRWYGSFFLAGGYALHPYPSLTNNIGHDGGGENCHKTQKFYWYSLAKDIEVNLIPIEESKQAIKSMKEFYSPDVSNVQKIKFKLKQYASAINWRKLQS